MLVQTFQCNYFDDPGDIVYFIGNDSFIKSSNFTATWLADPSIECYGPSHTGIVYVALAVRCQHRALKRFNRYPIAHSFLRCDLPAYVYDCFCFCLCWDWAFDPIRDCIANLAVRIAVS
jgi:hypothetical protein